MTVIIRDTLSGELRSAVARDGGNNGKTPCPVSIYLCGVTVYDDAHIGHARTIIVFDVLRRFLQSCDIAVRMIQNFTDVDDKIIARARTEGVGADVISCRYMERYHAEFEQLNVIPADLYPKATEHIPEIVSFIEDLIDAGSAYISKNGVYFAVSGFDSYGKLSKKRVDELASGARIDIDTAKRDPLDFALWKFSNGNDRSNPSWDSPWGSGRPGWHIECSAMSGKYLGDGLDIHGGGRDLIFPHHENEIAQSESRTDGEFARIWMHVGMVTIRGEKMSKSLGNIRSVRKALEDWGPNVIRLFCLSGHYSKPIDYSEENLQESLVRWRQLEMCLYELRHLVKSCRMDDAAPESDGTRPEWLAAIKDKFNAALNNDLNTHLSLSALMSIVSKTNGMIADAESAKSQKIGAGWAAAAESEMLYMMGILGLSPVLASVGESGEIDARVAERAALRDAGRYAEADSIRDALGAQNIELVDRAGRTVWVKRERIGMDTR